jgi:hypothetical protein
LLTLCLSRLITGLLTSLHSDDSDNEDAPQTPSSGKVAFAAPTSPGGAAPARRGRENSATTASGAAQSVAGNGRRSQAMTSFAANEKKRKFKLVRDYNGLSLCCGVR